MSLKPKIITEKTEIEGVLLVKHRVFEDQRGTFFEAFHSRDFEEAGIHSEFLQDNQSTSQKGVIRGIHYQIKPHLQAKLVRCSHGKIFDVVVDLREDSKTFGKWLGVELNGSEGLSIYIPEGIGHGFQVLNEGSVVSYKTSTHYAPEFEKGVHPFDPDLNIQWPMKSNLVLSEKDQSWAPMSTQFPGIF